MNFQAKRKLDFWFGGALLMLLYLPARLLGRLLRRDHSLDTRRGCVVIKMVGAGSLFLAMPSLQAIREKFPPGKFFLVGTRAVTAFIEGQEWFDAAWTIDDSSLFRLLASSTRVLWRIHRHADHLIDLEVHSRLTSVLCLLSMVRNRIGFVDEIAFWRRGFYTHMTYFNVHGPVYAFYDLLATWFGIGQIAVREFNARFRRRMLAQALPAGLALPERYIAIGHACSDLGKEREVLADEWKRILQPLRAAGASFVLLGALADAAAADQIIAAVGAGENLCGRLSIAQSTRVIAGADAFYGIDSLLLHLARALAVETVSIWGPTDPTTRLRPLPNETGVTSERNVFTRMSCAPCIHINESPPCQGRRDCMAQAVDHLTGTVEKSLPQMHDYGDVALHRSVGWNIPPDGQAVITVLPVSIIYL
jgi:ADP-heptose:LPS heptosyltransferase